ncbi:putative nucleotidyltransferase substrate binding domain-containing protein [Desulfolutivibrio sp.]|uniref:putative nucleotidyltransferase substrate binding domain-containing protein n=1 Tax=Desulfolutivibrio sp. TaxID=2773296 RepID=UPI002F96A3E3
MRTDGPLFPDDPADELRRAERLLATRGHHPALLPEAIARAESVSALALLFADLRNMALCGVDAGIASRTLGLLISEVSDHLLARAARIVEGGMDGPLGDFCLVALGSEGRREQFFATDQDNGLILAESDAPDGSGEGSVAAFSQEFIAALTAIGFPPCENRVMIDNPDWRKPLEQWKETVDDVVREPDGPGILVLSLLADARPVTGNAALCHGLAAHLRKRVADSPVTLGYMAREALRFPPPLGFFNTLAVERSGPDKGGLDIKKRGIFALVQGLRTMALEQRLLATGTPERLAALAEQGIFSQPLARRLHEAYDVLQTLRIRFQAKAIRRGETPRNTIFPDNLDDLERDRLKDSLHAVVELQELVYARYGLHLFP